LKRGEQKPDPQKCGTATQDAAKLLNVSPRSVENAKLVIEQGSKELIEAVEQGEMTKDLALLISRDTPWLTTEDFLDALDRRLQERMA
jgi:isocitrate dehydrogenase